MDHELLNHNLVDVDGFRKNLQDMINFKNNESNDAHFIPGAGSTFLDYGKYVRILNISTFWNGL